jgi:hypothetical protein
LAVKKEIPLPNCLGCGEAFDADRDEDNALCANCEGWRCDGCGGERLQTYEEGEVYDFGCPNCNADWFDQAPSEESVSARTYAVAVVRGNRPYLRVYVGDRLERELPVSDPLGLAVDLITAHRLAVRDRDAAPAQEGELIPPV